jgi:PAS domain S-box-containing protein
MAGYEILVLETLLDTLLSGLSVDLVGVLRNEGARDQTFELMRSSPEFSADAMEVGIRRLHIPQTGMLPKTASIAGTTIFLHATLIKGDVSRTLVVGSRRQDFPTEDESRVLSHTLLQASIGLQHARKDRGGTTQSSYTADLAEVVDSLLGLAWSAAPDGSAEYFNGQYLSYVGKSADQLRGVGWAATVHPDDIEGLAAEWRRMLSELRGGEAEARMRRFDGEYRWFLFRTNPLLDRSGALVRWYGLNIDIEDRKRAADALMANEFHLRQLTETIPQALERHP